MEINLLFLIFKSGFIFKTFGYIDPGSGSMFIQMIVGALAGAGIAMKIYWNKIKEKIMFRKKNNE